MNGKILKAESSNDSISSLDVEIELMEARVDEMNVAVQSLERAITEQKYDKKLRLKQTEIRQQEQDRAKIQDELKTLQRQGETRSMLASERKQLKDKERSVQDS